MREINVLVLGVGGNVGQGILKALKLSELSYNLINACVSSTSLGLYTGDKAYISPYANDESFIPWLIKVCNDEAIDIIITGVEEVIEILCINYDILSSQTKAVSVFSNGDQLKIGNDKFLTCEWLKNNQCNYPYYARTEHAEEIETILSKVGYPLIAKPRKGKGSQGIHIIHSNDELESIKTKKDYIIQEYIGDDTSEYTVGCYCDKHGDLVDCIIFHRELKFGTTFVASVVDNTAILNEVKKICNKFRPKGPYNLQFRLSKDGRPVCFEMNVRLSGTTPIRARFGFNDVEALIREYVLEESIHNFFHITKGTAYRYWDEFYISEEMQKELHSNGVVDNVRRFTNFTEGFHIN
jgi:carbamoyl-phosphate synthase large subunit